MVAEPLIEFDTTDGAHDYYVNGVLQPSVTQVLKIGFPFDADYGGMEISEDVLDNARDRGVVIHEVANLHALGTLDYESVEEEIAPYLDALMAWEAEKEVTFWKTEQLCFNPSPGYCGTVDAVVMRLERATVVDYKTGSSGVKPWHKYQIAAYAATQKVGDTWPDGLILQLKSNGKFKEHRYPASEMEWNFKVFEACHTLWLAKAMDSK